MNKPIGRRRLRPVVSLLALMSLGVGGLIAAPAAVAEDPPIAEGTTITADPSSPTGYTVTFVYHNPNATQVRLAGDLTLLGIGTGNTRFQPEDWQQGRYHSGGTEFLRDMTVDEDGYWSVSLPLHAGGLSYWYRVWDPTQDWTNKRIWDPASTHPRPPGDASFRVRNNDVLDAVYVPYAEKQNDPVLAERAVYELPAADPADRGTVQYIEYTTILGDSGHYLGVYLPAGYDPDRAEPYKVAYMAHGIFGDETDFMVPVNAPNILDNLTARGEIEPTVLVTMGNHFSPTGFAGYDQQNAAENLVEVILPLVEGSYNVSSEREGRAYGGFSFGAMTSSHVLRTFPTTFAFYGLFSGTPNFPALTDPDYDAIAAAIGDEDLFVFLGNGIFEGNLNAANAVANSFISRGYSAYTTQVPGAHDGMTAGQLFTQFARDWLWTGVDSVSVTPATADVTLGWVKQFTADVMTNNDDISKEVTWSVEGAESAGTTISADGLLSVAADESAPSLTVVATSVVDPTKSGSAQVELATPGSSNVAVKAQAKPASVVAGATFTLNVDVRSQAKPQTAPTVTGEIAVTFAGATQVVPLTDGKAVVELPTAGLSAGVYQVHVAYSGDPTYAPYAADHQELRVR